MIAGVMVSVAAIRASVAECAAMDFAKTAATIRAGAMA